MQKRKGACSILTDLLLFPKIEWRQTFSCASAAPAQSTSTLAMARSKKASPGLKVEILHYMLGWTMNIHVKIHLSSNSFEWLLIIGKVYWKICYHFTQGDFSTSIKRIVYRLSIFDKKDMSNWSVLVVVDFVLTGRDRVIFGQFHKTFYQNKLRNTSDTVSSYILICI